MGDSSKLQTKEKQRKLSNFWPRMRSHSLKKYDHWTRKTLKGSYEYEGSYITKGGHIRTVENGVYIDFDEGRS